MTDDEIFELSRRKALAGLGTIGAASAGAGLGTSAFFSDTESFTGNSLQAGTLDMVVAYEEHYSDWSPDEDDNGVDVNMWDGSDPTGGSGDLTAGYTGLPANDAWLIEVDDPDQFLANTQEDTHPDTFDRQDFANDANPCGSADFDDGSTAPPAAIELGDVKPGDFGEVTFSFGLCDNPGFVWANAANVTASENGVTEPEYKDEDEDQQQAASGDPPLKTEIQDDSSKDPNASGKTVELLDAVQAAVWVDDGNNYQNGDEEPVAAGSLRTVLSALQSGDGVPLGGDISPETGGGMGRNCFSASTIHDVVFAWWLPVDHANEIQSDTVTFDLGFYTEQCRHNDGSIVLSGSSPQGQGAGFANPWDTTTSVAHTGSGAWGTIDRSGQGISSYKQGFYFGGDFDNNNVLQGYTVADIEDISYWLYEPTALEGVDIYLNIYTEAENDGNDAAWYDSRLQALPSEANDGSPNFTAGSWNEFSTSGSASNTLVWSDTGRGGNFNNPLPTLDDIQADPVDWDNYGANLSGIIHDYRDEEVLALSLQVGSVSGISLEAYIDDVTVTLKSGEVMHLDLEP